MFSNLNGQNKKEILKKVKKHSEAIYIKEGWIRDPYIILGPDNYYYLTGTTPLASDPREKTDIYNVGIDDWPEKGDKSIVGSEIRLWRSKDLASWETLETPYTLEETFDAFSKAGIKKTTQSPSVVWAPEFHWLGDRWALVHCPMKHSTMAISNSGDLTDSEWTHPSMITFDKKHDPSLFKDDDGTWYLLWGNTAIAPIKADFSGLAKKPQRIDPADRVIGHEGATMRKIGDKYVHFGTGWSVDKKREGGGSYNLYYCTSDKITGPYSERKFVGRFLGHGTPFKDKSGNWWCTAFFNGNVPPLKSKGIEKRDLSGEAQSINEQGTTIVPLEVRILEDGEVFIRAKDPHYRNPGPDEAQKFEMK